jgi:hypothetical protein
MFREDIRDKKEGQRVQKLEANFASQRVAHGQTSRNSEQAK